MHARETDRADALPAGFEPSVHELDAGFPRAHRPSPPNLQLRFDMMLDVIPDWRRRGLVLCDLGCGTGELFGHLRRRGLNHVRYVGIDASPQAIEQARARYPDAEFHVMDVNAADAPRERLACDYLVASGLFTEKGPLTDAQMWAFFDATLAAVWPHVRRGIAFNVMSTAVDWRRDDLFHASADDLLRRLHAIAGHRVRLRADYGLHEYTAYMFRPSNDADRASDVPPREVEPPAEPTLPVMRPQLPDARRLLPYLERIDAARIYSNFGPLATELEQRLADAFGLPAGTVVTASSGLDAIVGAILGGHGRASTRPLALIPAYTFVATAVAVEHCGYRPVLVDVDPDTWLMSPDTALAHPDLERVGLVVPVAALGRPVEQAPWRAFRERTGIPVVIDGAASFDSLDAEPERYCGEVPVALSFHATKSFGVGEGGAVVTTDTALALNVSRALNFGFHAARDSRTPSTNGKMSEYHAAVGLAELDGWYEKQRRLRAVADAYRGEFAARNLATHLQVAPSIGASYVVFVARDPAQARAVCDAMVAAGLDFRLWYGLGLHRQTYFSGLPHMGLAVTDDLAPRLIGLPVAPDLPRGMIARVAEVVALAAR